MLTFLPNPCFMRSLSAIFVTKRSGDILWLPGFNLWGNNILNLCFVLYLRLEYILCDFPYYFTYKIRNAVRYKKYNQKRDQLKKIRLRNVHQRGNSNTPTASTPSREPLSVRQDNRPVLLQPGHSIFITFNRV